METAAATTRRYNGEKSGTAMPRRSQETKNTYTFDLLKMKTVFSKRD
jgi:hypothetical protein